MKLPHLIKNLLFYIGLFLLLFGMANVLFDLTEEKYQLTITYISYFGLYMMIFGDAYPKGARDVHLNTEDEIKKMLDRIEDEQKNENVDTNNEESKKEQINEEEMNQEVNQEKENNQDKR